MDNVVWGIVAGCIDRKLKHSVKKHPLFENSFRIGYIIRHRNTYFYKVYLHLVLLNMSRGKLIEGEGY